MIHIYLHQNKMIHIYAGVIDAEDIKSFKKIMQGIYDHVESDSRLINFVDLSTAKVLNTDLSLELADYVKKYQHLYEIVYLSKFPIFIHFLHKIYLKYSGLSNLHNVLRIDFDEMCRVYHLPPIDFKNPKIHPWYYASTKNI